MVNKIQADCPKCSVTGLELYALNVPLMESPLDVEGVLSAITVGTRSNTLKLLFQILK